MAIKGKGLGKGLDTLIPSEYVPPKKGNEDQKGANEAETIVKITKVEPNREQPRKHFDEDALQELADSIKQFGLLQPILVQDRGDYYEIIAGERRWRAAKLAGLKEVPVIIRNYTNQEIVEISLIENIQREDLNAYEKALGIKNLMEDYELTQEEVAKILGKSRSTIANSVRILNLNPDVLEFAKEGKLTEGHCKALMAITDPKKQYETAIRMIEKGESVRVAEKKARLKKKSPGIDSKYQVLFNDIEDSFQSFFGTKVKLDAGRKKGKIVIEYNSNEDLERILDLIK